MPTSPDYLKKMGLGLKDEKSKRKHCKQEAGMREAAEAHDSNQEVCVQGREEEAAATPLSSQWKEGEPKEKAKAKRRKRQSFTCHRWGEEGRRSSVFSSPGLRVPARDLRLSTSNSHIWMGKARCRIVKKENQEPYSTQVGSDIGRITRVDSLSNQGQASNQLIYKIN